METQLDSAVTSPQLTSIDMSLLPYRNPVWANAAHTSLSLEVQWEAEGPWTPYATASFDPESAGAAFFARVVLETPPEDIGPYVSPAIMYSIPKGLPWDRMTDDEADSFDAWLTSTSTRYRNMYNAAADLAYNQLAVSTLWAPFYASAKNLFGRTRAQELMASVDNLLHPYDPV